MEGGQTGVGLHVSDAFGIGAAKGALQSAHAVVVIMVERYVLGIVGRRGGLLLECGEALPERGGLAAMGGGPIVLLGFFVKKFQQGEDDLSGISCCREGRGSEGMFALKA